MIIPPRYNGPPDSANGGYACGLMSEALGGGFEVTLLRPPPLGVDLDLVGHEVRQGDILIAEARRAPPFAGAERGSWAMARLLPAAPGRGRPEHRRLRRGLTWVKPRAVPSYLLPPASCRRTREGAGRSPRSGRDAADRLARGRSRRRIQDYGKRG